ncbi:MAG: SGNH/GDSL hydrolase family protein, partial [Bacteroidetes bacterium]
MAYPALLAQKFSRVGGGAFPQPLYSEAQKDGTGYLRLLNIPAPLPNIQPFGPTSQGFMGGIIGVNGSTPLYAKHTGANNNFGVPGIRIADVQTAGYGFSNPVAFNSHFERLLGATNALSNYKDYVLANSTGATFFSMWLGNNDVLGYATAGGTGSPMTDLATFTTLYRSMLDGITGIASKGVLVTIPQVTVAPHFKTLTRTSLLASINAALPAGSNPVTNIFIDASGTTRAATDADLFLLGAQADYGNFGKTNVGTGQPFPYGLHPNNPLKDASVLDTAE